MSKNSGPDYKIKPNFSHLNDEASVKYHLQNDDYFGTIATIISLIKQSLEDKKNNVIDDEEIIKTLDCLEEDLVFLQKNYEINLKPKLKYSQSKK